MANQPASGRVELDAEAGTGIRRTFRPGADAMGLSLACQPSQWSAMGQLLDPSYELMREENSGGAARAVQGVPRCAAVCLDSAAPPL